MDDHDVSDFRVNGGLTPSTLLLSFSLTTPIYVILCVFLFVINSRLLSLNRFSLSGPTTSDRRRRPEGTEDKGTMAYNPYTYSTGLLDDRNEDITIQPLRPLFMKSLQNENSPPFMEGQMDLLGNLADDLKITVLDPKRPPRLVLSPPHPRNATLPNTTTETEEIYLIPSIVKWGGKISWALKGSSVFDDADEELDAFNNRSNMLVVRQPYSELWVFQYGLRYIPSVSDLDVYRTIRIDEFPPDKKLGQILPSIVGEIYSARLAETSAITGYNTAMITFVTQEDALKFVIGVTNKVYTLPFGKLMPVHTPTYPMPADTERLIKQKGYTRTIGVFHTRPTLKMELTRVLTNPYLRYAMQLESISDGPAYGEVDVKMLSVKGAATVFDWLRTHPTLGQCHFRFLKQDGSPSENGNVMGENDTQHAAWA
ncbi:hypothetical protein BDW69DRAFT_185693 [Aspergillus filifer]